MTNIPVLEQGRNVGKKLGVNVSLPKLYRLRFSKSFQSDNHVHCDLNNSTLDFLTSAQRSAEVRALQHALSFGVCMSALCGLRFTDFGRVAFSCKQRFQFI